MNFGWQEEAQQAFVDNKCRGLVVAVTGSGKTVFGIKTLKLLKQRTLIVVPTIVLLKQWVDELIKNGIPENKIGTYYGENKEIKEITVSVINSACTRNDWNMYKSFLIVDEVHRLNNNTTEFQKLLLNNSFNYTLGLTATIDLKDGIYGIVEQKIGPVIYNYTYKDAQKADTISDLTIINKGINLPTFDYKKLEQYNNRIAAGIKEYKTFENLIDSSKKRDYKATAVLRLMATRKKIYNNNPLKMEAVIDDLVFHKNDKSIVFNEYKTMADKLYMELKKKNIPVWLYHSGTLKKDYDPIGEFTRSPNGVLVTVKALDEGLNVKDASRAFLIGYNTTDRQAIQRVGRIIRKHGNKKSYIHNYYFKNTKDFTNAENFSNLFKDIAQIKWVEK